jgi:hypothetical protein
LTCNSLPPAPARTLNGLSRDLAAWAPEPTRDRLKQKEKTMKRCDNASVGVLIERDGRYLIFDRDTFPASPVTT